jgi:hypothetical protein
MSCWLGLEVPGGIGSLVQDADDLDHVAHDPKVKDVTPDRPDTTAGEEARHADADFRKFGKRRDRPQEDCLIPVALIFAPMPQCVGPNVNKVGSGIGREDDPPFRG